jgi:hypothetical protein
VQHEARRQRIAVPPATVTRKPRALSSDSVARKPEIVDARPWCGRRGSLESDLELARQLRAERMPQQVARQRFGVRRDVEQLVVGDTGKRARGDVAHRVCRTLRASSGRLPPGAHRGSTSCSRMKWNCTFCRVVMWPKPRE